MGGRMDPLALSYVFRPRFQTATIYDDVYRETGAQYRHQVNRFEHVSRLEAPLGSGRGGLGLEFRHLAADIRMNPQPEEETYLVRRIQRLTAGIGGHLWDGRLTSGGCMGVNRAAGVWLPEGSLALAVRPHRAVSLTALAGRWSDLRTLDYQTEGEEYHAEVKVRHSWWTAGLRLDFSRRVRISVEYRHSRTNAPARWYKGDGFGFNPVISTGGVYGAVKLQPTEGTSIIFKWKTLTVDGSGEAFYYSEQMGKFTGIIQDETDVELGGTCRLAPLSRVSFSYGNYHITSILKGHLDPWPFSDAIFAQVFRIYFRGSGEARADRLAARYTRDAGTRENWSFQVGYVWLTPDFELLQRRTKLIIFDSGEIFRSYLNIIQAEFLVPEVRKTVVLGEITLTYAFAKAIPTRIRYREKPPPVEPPEEKVAAKGGSFHLLKLSYVW